MNDTSLGAYIRAKREKTGLSVRQLAADSGLHYSYVSRIENGERSKVDPDDLQKLAKALNIDASKLLRFIGIKPTTVIPTPRAYFRRAYGITPTQASEAAERMEQIVRELRDHHDNNKKSRGGTRP